ncbi:tyrosine-type recombinase/integrase [Paracoccus yeei]|uniref:Site-specific integrase n=1 Tax=Paracoccus yeei TaxID=147645 RepID=A0A5P2QT07_9RHOB|nr:tyrosine-type recombinase/integrase [Paracoccus yeei]QEU08713.1 site-specific integrase [Paracoccus yeei]
MAGANRYLLNRDGRFFARLVVPKELRGLVGKTELRAPLGPDRRTAMRLLPGAVAQLQHQIAQAERAGTPATTVTRYPLAPDQIALISYRDRLRQDDETRKASPAWASVDVDLDYAAALRAGMAGRLTDAALQELVGQRIARFREIGSTDALPGSTEWRNLAQMLCTAEYEALARVVERDEGNFNGQPEAPFLTNATAPEDAPKPVKLSQLWKDYVASRQSAGFMKDGGRRNAIVIVSLRKFLGHNDARQITRKNLLDWRDHLLKHLSAKTVSDIYLSAVRSLLKWAHENEKLPENPSATVKQDKPRRQRTREAGYTDAEAVKALKLSRSYQPPLDKFGNVREAPETTNSKRWVPIICAFTGARVSEITQLRKEDVRQEGTRWVIRITPEAGSLKAGHYRDVPIHAQIIAEGFIDFVNQSNAGPLFHTAKDPKEYASRAQRASNRIAEWLRVDEIAPEGVQPSHAWRHRFKTIARDIGADSRVVDAIQGHASRTASDDYGDVSLAAKARVIDALPDYDMT